MITEDLLHYIWKYQKFSNKHLLSTERNKLRVLETGLHNHDSGPDFEQARIIIDEIEWVGNVEIHINSSDWHKHNHSSDPAYQNVILHVVYHHDEEVLIDNHAIITLALQEYIDPSLIESCESILFSKAQIPCGTQINSHMDLVYASMLDKVLVERLREKATTIHNILKEEHDDWEETCYQVLAGNFGFSVNKHAFHSLAKRLPYRILKKHLNDSFKTDALIIGQAGFLTGAKQSYQKELHSEHLFLSAKYNLQAPLKKHEWKFGKMRPANFPIVRLAQFASFLSTHPRIFSLIIETTKPAHLIKSLHFELVDYWKHHYDFDKPRKKQSTFMGKGSFQNMIINTVVPLLAAYSKYTGSEAYLNSALRILEELPSEKNRITKEWSSLNRKAKNAFDSQAQIQLFNEYCTKRKCLSCSIGVSLLQRD